jgi:hypothetical protein
MSIGSDPSVEVEKERTNLIEEFTADRGTRGEDRYRPGTFGCHELLDRTGLLADQIEKNVLSHPSCFQNPEWYALASRAVEVLRDLYQRVGAEHI